MQKGMEIQYHNWKATCILSTSREVQFESKLVQIVVDFWKDGAFQAQGLTSWPRVNELFSKDLPKHGNGNNSIDWPNHLQLEWEYKSSQPTHGWGGFFWATPQIFTYDGTACLICFNPYGQEEGWILGTCPHMYHPQCIIPYMVHYRHCVLCQMSFHIICNVQPKTLHATTLEIQCSKCT
jgi:hypothetical protein